MITCKLNGRLGNNMFQIANLINVAEKLNTNFVLPTYMEAGHYGKLATDLNGFSYEFKKEDVILPNKFSQPSYEYFPITEYKDDTEFHGFYQSYKYFNDIREKLINKYFKFNDYLKKYCEEKYDVNCNCLGIGVRRGDYLMLQNNHCVLDIESYYNNAIHSFTESVIGLEKIFVFSDDFSWCKSMFKDSVYYVEEEKFAQLYMMTQMKHFIMSNSTFDWWGCFLNNNNGTIMMPDPWFGPNNAHLNTEGLQYPLWKIQKHEIKIA